MMKENRGGWATGNRRILAASTSAPCCPLLFQVFQERSMARNRPGNHSRRFLTPQEISRAHPIRAWGSGEFFAEGQWQTIRVTLEREGWHHSQIEQVHDQLRRGWPLVMAKRNAAVLSGHCPLAARQEA